MIQPDHRRAIPRALLLAMAVCLAAPSADAATREVSADGRTVASNAAAVAPPIRRGDGPFIFGDAPDWQNTLRRQVGGLAAADLDGDGRPDLVVVCYQSNSFPPYEDWRNMIHFNGEDGLETEPSWISDDQVHSSDVVIADIDDDGFPDLVLANGGGAYAPNSIHFGSADGPDTSPGWTDSQPAWTNAIAVADIDGDGWLDLVTANQGRGSGDDFRPMYLFRNIAGTLETTASWQSAEASIQNSLSLADLDGDGDLDIGVAKWVNFESAAYENLDGTPDDEPFWTLGSTESNRGIELADFDGDGLPDILLGIGNTLTVLRNNGDGSFAQIWAAGQTASHQDLLVADFDNDGRPDIVDIDFSTARVHLYLNGPDGLDVDPVWSYDPPGAGTALVAADFNGDGLLDLAIGYSGEPSVVVFYNQFDPGGDGSADLDLALAAAPDQVAPGDTVTFQATVGNLGPDDADDVTVAFMLPPELAFSDTRDADALGPDWTCQATPDDTVLCELADTLPDGGLAPALHVTATVLPDAEPGTIQTSAVLTSPLDDPDPDNNLASVQTQVIDKGDHIFANGFETPEPAADRDPVVHTGGTPIPSGQCGILGVCNTPAPPP